MTLERNHLRDETGQWLGYIVAHRGHCYEWRCRGWLSADGYESEIWRDGTRLTYSEPHDSGTQGASRRVDDGSVAGPELGDEFWQAVRLLHGAIPEREPTAEEAIQVLLRAAHDATRILTNAIESGSVEECKRLRASRLHALALAFQDAAKEQFAP